jgi:Heterokaryon incompatibility protein (HET)
VLQRNLHAREAFRKHEISWAADSEDTSIRQWVSAIRPGDTVQIIPNAQYAAWKNFVREAEIELHGTRISQDPPVPHVPRLAYTTPKSVVDNNTGCYRQLDGSLGEVRLILLNPGAYGESITCSLIYTPLLNCTVKYEALSYCWGDPRHRQDISVTVPETGGYSKFVLSITSDLYSAIETLRPRTGLERTLWIDAVCINQADLDERAQQVARMREIYRKANKVIVWLGVGNEVSKRSIATIEAIGARYDRLSQPHEINGSELSSLHDPLMTKDLGVDQFVDDWPLFNLSWFRRTWVVQEVFNARDILVCCGDDTLTWPMLLQVNRCIRASELKMNSAYKALIPPVFEDIFASKASTSLGDSCSTTLGILEILVKGLDLDATDPRDKLFAMLQFGKETGAVEELPDELLPNYQKSIVETFSDFTRWWILERQSLQIFSAIQALEGRSWLDNFWERAWKLNSGHPTWSWSYRGHSNWAVGILGLSAEPSYQAAADTKPDVKLISESRKSSLLPLTGIKVDLISEIMPYPYFSPPANHEDLHRAYIGIFDPLNLTGKWTHQLGSKYYDSYVGDDNQDLIWGHYAAHSGYSSKTAAVECHGNCFFLTQERELLGLCPFSAQPGDLIVILHGGPVPYVLREQQIGIDSESHNQSRRYELIGECYLEGYMYGAGIKEQKINGLPSETFVLV